jgi:hypothetical protein
VVETSRVVGETRLRIECSHLRGILGEQKTGNGHLTMAGIRVRSKRAIHAAPSAEVAWNSDCRCSQSMISSLWRREPSIKCRLGNRPDVHISVPAAFTGLPSLPLTAPSSDWKGKVL